MSCIVMKYESLAALANAVEARLNCDYNFGALTPRTVSTGHLRTAGLSASIRRRIFTTGSIWQFVSPS